jgi:Rps23 Pro-64 3,4-dihydroxylase Tpa1-like proline 4-hydroxylase
MVPYRVYRDFLDSETHASLLKWAIENEAKFQPTLIADGKQDPSQRLSLRVRDFGPLKVIFHQRLLDLVPTLIADLRVTPFEPYKLSLELVANNDGAFFTRHVDTYLGEVRKVSDRALSAVYYFHGEPKAFSGGVFRLYGFAMKKDANNFVDFQPDQNTLLAFPSWAWHEVLPISCPSRRFSDSRFNVNCWVHRHANRIARPG